MQLWPQLANEAFGRELDLNLLLKAMGRTQPSLEAESPELDAHATRRIARPIRTPKI
jgi:hypothetical protein